MTFTLIFPKKIVIIRLNSKIYRNFDFFYDINFKKIWKINHKQTKLKEE